MLPVMADLRGKTGFSGCSRPYHRWFGKKTKIMTAAEKNTIALHEAGHATLSWFLEHANPLIKVTIVPRGRALGAAWYLPEERQITTKSRCWTKCVLL